MDTSSGTGGGNRFFPHLKQFVSVYAPPGVDDQRAIQTFMDCETTESIGTLRNEIRAIASGNFHGPSLDLVLGKGRFSKHGSYDNWAKLALLWMANYKS
jgi:hypothetical protein